MGSRAHTVRGGRGGSRLSRDTQTSLSPDTSSSSSGGSPRVVPGASRGSIVLQVCPGPFPGPSPPGVGTFCLEHAPEEGVPGGIRYRCPSHHPTGFLSMLRRSAALLQGPLPDGRAPHAISKGVHASPLLRKLIFSWLLYRDLVSFGHDPKFMAIGWRCRNVDRLVNSRASLFRAQLSLHTTTDPQQ
ncbi:hypothetical protein CRENBAI_009388 [Crenichthys baileyi]|uniref:Uncharacterized protein n=1 Tax=Crenichthys baileyi TaxID=28760 RepID=A0AAV9S132_9TELE